MIAIIGAGISGLTLAYELQKLGKEYMLIEATDRSGGYIRSVREGNYLFELGPNSILCDSEMETFIRELVKPEEILEPNPVSKDRFVFKNGAYRKLPSGPLSLATSNFFSLQTKIAIAKEATIQANPDENETLESFFLRRFNREIVDYALNPFVSGIYAGDPAQLLMNKTFPSLGNYEKEFGSVLKGFIRKKGGQRKKTLSFKNGLQTLTKALAAKDKDTFFKHEVYRVTKSEGEFLIEILSPAGYKTLSATKLVITAPAYEAKHFIYDLNQALSLALGKINYAPMAVVHTVYKKSQVSHPLNGFGGLHPKVEHLYASGSLWSSSIFPDRCPEDEVMFTCFVGGMLNTEKFQESDEAIMIQVNDELRSMYGINTDRPVLQKIYKWPNAIPQYDAYINEVYDLVDQAEKEQLYICANWKEGVSLSDCIHKARNLAKVLTAN
jgi:oxygen-dependent protoporphyrinogen oxidase